MPIKDINQRDDQGYLWLLVTEVSSIIDLKYKITSENGREGGIKRKSLVRKIEHWCAHGPIESHTYEATRQQMIELIAANRLNGFPPKDKCLYVISREGLAAGLAAIENPPQQGFPRNKKRLPRQK